MTHPRFSAPLLGLLALAAADSTHAAVNEWTETGPNAGWAQQVAIHPTNSQIALLSTVRGIYRTTDGTAHWTLVNEAATGRDLAFDPSSPNIVVHASEKVWLSTDGGQSFALAQSPPVDYIRQVEISQAGTIYVAGQNKVFKSTDHGSTWTSCGAPWPQGAWLGALVVDPNANAGGDHLFLRASDLSVSPTTSATWRSVNGCTSWIQAGAGDPAVSPNSVSHFAVMPGNPNRVLAAAYDGIYRSTNGGDTWTKVQSGTTDQIVFEPQVAGSVSAMGTFGRLMHSTNNGDTWDPFHGADIQISSDASFAFDPQTAGRLILASPQGAYLSTDGGLYYTLRVNGLHAANLGDFTTADDGTVYAVFRPGAGGVFRRDPNTLAWAALNNDDLKLKASTNGFLINAVATAPGNASRIYASLFPSNLSFSTDGGSNWGVKHPFFPVTNPVKQILDLAVDPDDELLAFAATENGIARTVNGGTTWAASNTGLPSYAKFVLPLRDSNVVYAIAQDPNVAYSNAVYKSTDNGVTWLPTGAMPALVAAGQLLSIAVDPQDSNVVYAGHNGGVYKSTNGGTSWTAMTFSGQAAPYATGMSVLVDPDYSTTLTLASASANSGVVRTTDGGVHWERISVPRGVSPNAPSLERAVLDPLRPNVLIAGVYPATISEYEVGTDLELSVSGIDSPLATSTTRVVTFTVKNLGPHAASPSELTLLLPAWLTPADPGDCGVAVQTVRCRIPPLWLNDSYTFSMPLAVSASGGTGPISVVLNTHETDTDMFSNSFSRTITGSEQANLALGLAVSRNNLDPGESMTLTMSVMDQGPSISTLTTVDLPIPAGIQVTGYTATQGTCAVTAGTFHCDVGTVPVGISRIINVDLLAVTPGTRDITAHADGAGTDSGLSHTNHFVLVVLPIGDLSVSLAESADPVTIGEDFSYTVTVKNLSGDAAGAVVPVSVTGTTIFRLVSASGMSCATALPTQVMNCEILSLPAGATATAVVGATAIQPGIATATATATHSGRDTNPDNNTATIGTTLRQVANLSVEISDSVDPASVAAPFQYTVTVRNSGPNNPAVNIAIPVTGANISNAVISYGSCTHNGSTANCTIPQLDTGGSQVVTITAFAAVPGTASATATASLAGFDPDTANNSATAETVVRALADIGVTIADSADPVTAGGVLSYLVTLTTAGPSPGNVHLTVPVTGSTVTGATPSQGGTCTVAAGSVTCDFAPMDFSPSTVNIVINSATAGTVTATATATFSGTDPVAANNTATATTTVNTPSSSSSSSGGGSSGGGGGGRFDWLAVILLGAALAARVRAGKTA